jgi:hypothetical protein
VDVTFFVGSGYAIHAGEVDHHFVADVGEHIRTIWGLHSRWSLEQDVSAVRRPSVVLTRQNRISFWISPRAIDVSTRNASNPAEPCIYLFPPATASEATAIVHRVPCRNHAQLKVYSASNAFTGFHELHHAAFGLSDEYAGTTYYFEQAWNPNLYYFPAACNADTVAVTPCRPIFPAGVSGSRWWRPDQDPDLMNKSADGVQQGAERRRVNWIFDRCAVGLC